MILRLLGAQGIAGIAISLALGILLLIQRGETGHWKRQSSRFEQLYQNEQAALAGTVANYRAAAEAARASDQAAAVRVADQQKTISQRTANDFQARLADARARAERLRLQPVTAATDSGGRASAPVPGLSTATGRPAQAPAPDRLSETDALTATEQAIQLDELIEWVRAQALVDPNAAR